MKLLAAAVSCLLLGAVPAPAAADGSDPLGLPGGVGPLGAPFEAGPELLRETVAQLTPEDGGVDPDLLRDAAAQLVQGVLPCAGGKAEQVIECVYDRVDEFVPTCLNIVSCLSMVHVSILPGYRLDYDVQWYSGQAWAMLPLVPPVRDNEGSLLYFCVNLEGQCGRLV